MRILRDIDTEDLIDFLNGQDMSQLNIYCQIYKLTRGGRKKYVVDRIHKKIMKIRGEKNE